MRTVVLRVVALALLLLLALVAVLTVRTIRHLPDAVVYMIVSDGTHFTLVPVGRRIGEGSLRERIEASVAALASGPSPSEAARGLATAVPADTRVLGVRRDGSTLTIDLSPSFEKGGGSAMMVGRLDQLLYTLTRVNGIEAVVLEIDGRRITAFAGEGIEIASPWRRPDSGALPTW